ncbi:MAG: IPExxxVDY family protein [Prevotellaceae bacterium]|nr:IPExxxVDY family protein [Prevotellaceae bacterium]
MGKQIKKIKLQLPDVYCLLAVYTVNKDYQLAWLLNAELGLHLQREVQPVGTFFSLYSDRESLHPLQFMLIANNSECRRLFSQYEQIDYFFKVSNATNEQLSTIMGKIRQIDSVITCTRMDDEAKLLKIFNRL